MDEAEWLTRKKRIDTRLTRTGWKVVRFSPQLNPNSLDKIAVEELPTANGPADYALFVGGRCLGIVEAKKVTVNPQNVLEQAKRYARGVFDAVGQWGEFRVPFLYASNGTLIWHLDTRPEKLISRQLSEFHTPDALDARFSHDTSRATAYLLDTPPEQIGRLRPYQRDCIVAVEAAITSGKHDMMVAMATGTGKTYLTVAQVYRLLESKLVRRILFLVDRKALAAQAVREFNAFNTPKGNKFTQEYEVYSQRFQKEDFGDDAPFDPKVLPNEYLTAPKASHTFVYISTIQRMARNLFGADGCFTQTDGDPDIDEDTDRLDIPIHAFDLIIADECHRGYSAQETSIWRNSLQHFDAVRVGLTATPAAHTVALFGEPVFRYGVQQANLDGWLVDYDPVVIRSNVRMNGVFLKEGEQIGKIDPETGGEALDNVEDEREFDASARGKPDFSIADPACGTGGFLVCSYEWLVNEAKGVFDRADARRIKTQTYYGQDLVPRPRRLALMNLFLHGVEPHIYLGDTVYEPFRGEKNDVILTNPPFGTKGANQAPEREDFTIETSNKQLNFVQHVMTALKPGGRAAMVLPDNCLFEGKAGEVFEILVQDCALHTVLRLPRGTFTPYSQGVKANVIFFQKGRPTEAVWIFDARSNVPGITKKDRPLTAQHFAEFADCYGKDPNGLSKRKDLGETGRFRKFHISEIKERGYKLDVTWLRDDSLEDADELPEPQDLAAEAITALEAVVDDLREIVALIEKEEGVEK